MENDPRQINAYLQQEVMTASPIRLRWMLVKRAAELCGLVSSLWRDDEYQQAVQWVIRVREILGELLDGVQDSENPVSREVGDLYIFLLKLLSEIEQSRDVEKMSTLQELLLIEAETWQLACEHFGREAAVGLAAASHLPSMNAGRAAKQTVQAGATSSIVTSFADGYESGFSLEI